MTSLAVVDDHAILAQALASQLQARNFEVQILDIDQPIVPQAQAAGVDMLLLDIELGEDRVSGIDLIEPLIDVGLPVIILSGVTDRMVIAEAVLRGATGVLSKGLGFDELIDAIEACINGDLAAPDPVERVRLINDLLAHRRDAARARRPFEQLTSRENEVLFALMAGLTPAEIGDAQFVSISTVRSHVKAIMRKLDVSSQLKAVALANGVCWSPDEAANAMAY